MSALERLPGDAGLIHETAQALAAAGEQLGALTDVVYGLRDARWDSLAGQAFANRMAAPPRVFSALARRYALAAQALHAYADAFALAQRHSALAAERFDHATGTLAVLEPQIGTARDDAERAGLQASYAAWSRCRADAEASWYAALEDYRAADARCAAVLDAASHDEIADTWQYRSLHIAQDEGARIATLGAVPTPWTKAIGAVAAGVSTAAMVTDKVIYGEGSWGQIAGDAALSAVGSGGRALTYAAKAGVSAIGPAERLGLGARLARGVQAETRARLTAWKPSAYAAAGSPSRGLVTIGRHAAPPSALSDAGIVRWAQVGARKGQTAVLAGRDAAVRSVEQKYAADFRLALRAGPEAEKLLYAGWGVGGGMTAYEKADKVLVYVTTRDEDRS